MSTLSTRTRALPMILDWIYSTLLKLMIMLEQQFCAEREITDDPSQIECVADLIRHIEQNHDVSRTPIFAVK
jgi:hypothetical protein